MFSNELKETGENPLKIYHVTAADFSTEMEEQKDEKFLQPRRRFSAFLTFFELNAKRKFILLMNFSFDSKTSFL